MLKRSVYISVFTILIMTAVYGQDEANHVRTYGLTDAYQKFVPNSDGAIHRLWRLPRNGRVYNFELTKLKVGVYEAFYKQKKWQTVTRVFREVEKNFTYPLNEIEGEIAYLLGTAYLQRGYNDSAQIYFEKQLPIVVSTAPTYEHKLLANLGLAHKRKENFGLALLYYKRSLNLRENWDLKGKENIYNNLATLYFHLGELDSAYKYIQFCLEIEPRSRRFDSYLHNLGRYFELKGKIDKENGDFLQAVETHKKVLALRLTPGDIDTTRLFATYYNIGANFQFLEEFDSAWVYYDKALTLEGSLIPRVDRIQLRKNLRNLYFAQKDFGKGMEQTAKIKALNALAEPSSIERLKKHYLEEIEDRNYALFQNSLNEQRRTRQILLVICLTFVMAFIFLFLIYAERKKRNKEKLEHLAILKFHQEKWVQENVIARQEAIRKLSQELHDGVQNEIWAWYLNLGENEKDSRTRLDRISENLEVALKGIRPECIYHGIMPSLHELKEQFDQKAFDVILESRGVMGRRFSGDVELAIYRIVQEALNNIIKYAEAKQVTIQLIHDPMDHDMLTLMIEDNGNGFDLGSFKPGLGIQGMRSRALELNGSLEIDSSPGHGTTIMVNIPAEVKGFEHLEVSEKV